MKQFSLITKDKSPLLAVIKEPSPSENLINHSKNLFEGCSKLG